MGGPPWPPLSDTSAHGVVTEDAGSSLTGMGVARGAGMHWALDRSAGGGGERGGHQHTRGQDGSGEEELARTWSHVPESFQPVGGHLRAGRKKTETESAGVCVSTASVAYICGGGRGLPQTLPVGAGGLCLGADISLAALQAQFLGQILGQLGHSGVLEVRKEKGFSIPTEECSCRG